MKMEKKKHVLYGCLSFLEIRAQKTFLNVMYLKNTVKIQVGVAQTQWPEDQMTVLQAIATHCHPRQ